MYLPHFMVTSLRRLSPKVEAARSAYFSLIEQYLAQIGSGNGAADALQRKLLEATEHTPRAVRIEGLRTIIQAHIEHFELVELSIGEDALEYWKDMKYGANSPRYGLVTKMFKLHERMEAQELEALELPADLYERTLHTPDSSLDLMVSLVDGLEPDGEPNEGYDPIIVFGEKIS